MEEACLRKTEAALAFDHKPGILSLRAVPENMTQYSLSYFQGPTKAKIFQWDLLFNATRT